MKLYKFDGIRALTLVQKFESEKDLMETFNKASNDRIITKVIYEKQYHLIVTRDYPPIIFIITEKKEK